MQKNVADGPQSEKAGGEESVPSDDAVKTLHGGDAKGDSELVLPAHDDENPPDEERRSRQK